MVVSREVRVDSKKMFIHQGKHRRIILDNVLVVAANVVVQFRSKSVQLPLIVHSVPVPSYSQLLQVETVVQFHQVLFFILVDLKSHTLFVDLPDKFGIL